jgi:hypothetical protein
MTNSVRSAVALNRVTKRFSIYPAVEDVTFEVTSIHLDCRTEWLWESLLPTRGEYGLGLKITHR